MIEQLDLSQIYIDVPDQMAVELETLSKRLENIPFERKEEACEVAKKILDIMDQIKAYNTPIH